VMNSPGNDAARRPGPDNQAAGGTRETKTKQQTLTIHSIQCAQRIVDSAALLALDLATLAAEGGRAHHARAALHLRDATAAAWLAAEALAEGVAS
jgi:hypothetical protein